MENKRVLINFDVETKFETYLDPGFDIDMRPFQSVDSESPDTLSEYDVIILSKRKPFEFPDVKYNQLLNFLSLDNKLLVIILNKLLYNERGFSNNFWANITNHYTRKGLDINKHSKGSTYELTENAKLNLFYKYLKHNKRNWELSFNIADDSNLEVLARNTDKNIVAYSLKDERVKATTTFIPWIEENEELFWNVINNFLLGKSKIFEDVEEWVKSYTFPKLSNIENNIKQKEKEIASFKKQKTDFESEETKY